MSLAAFGQTVSSGLSGTFGTPDASQATKFADPSLGNISMTQYVTSDNIAYRIAIPDTASAMAPYDVLVSIEAPATVSWAGIAWGGGMIGDPLTVAWPSTKGMVVTTRLATAHAPGKFDNDTSGTILPTSKIDANSWRADILCKGCSAWMSADGVPGTVNPSSNAVTFAYAASTDQNSVMDPTSDRSPFTIHTSLGTWNHDVMGSKVPNFDASLAQIMAAGNGAAAGNTSAAGSGPATGQPMKRLVRRSLNKTL